MSQNTLELAKAQSWAKLYREKNPNSIIAYLIPGIDFTQLINQNGVVNIRAYVGIDPDTGLQKLMLVGVDANGNDLISEKNKDFIYDFTRPCPEQCDIDSPLFTLK
jgi:hypothetical protein